MVADGPGRRTSSACAGCTAVATAGRPGGRSPSSAAGLGSLVVATQSGLAAYDTTLLWVHMVQHMILAMVAPVFLALGAPITLALRTLPPRPRRGLLAVIHSWPAQILTFPVVAGVLFVATPFALYFTPLYEATLRHPWLHELNHMHFLIVGCLWFWPLLGLDPMPNRLPYGLRMFCAVLVLPFHAFLGISIMSASTVLAGDWYYALGRTVGAVADRRPADRRRAAVGLRRPRRAARGRHHLRPVDAGLRARGQARGPPAGRARRSGRPGRRPGRRPDGRTRLVASPP